MSKTRHPYYEGELRIHFGLQNWDDASFWITGDIYYNGAWVSDAFQVEVPRNWTMAHFEEVLRPLRARMHEEMLSYRTDRVSWRASDAAADAEEETTLF